MPASEHLAVVISIIILPGLCSQSQMISWQMPDDPRGLPVMEKWSEGGRHRMGIVCPAAHRQLLLPFPGLMVKLLLQIRH